MRKEAKPVEEVNKLLQADKAQNSPHLPKKLLAKGRPTAKALKYNRKLIKEGRTTYYIDPDKLINLKTLRPTKITIDRNATIMG